MPCTHDLRGKTSLRQLAAVLHHCRLFVGLVGMPMHMARAVDCPSVIVYGGRERPDQTGYICNENLYRDIPCSPCWLDRRCDFGRVCLDTISAGEVIEAAERMLARPRDGLAVASYEIAGGSAGTPRPILADPPADRSPALSIVSPAEVHPDGPTEPMRPQSMNMLAKGITPMKHIAKGLLSINLASAIRLARFGPKDAGWRLAAAYRQINPFGEWLDNSNPTPTPDTSRNWPSSPRSNSRTSSAGSRSSSWNRPPIRRRCDALCDAMAILAVVVDRAPGPCWRSGRSTGTPPACWRSTCRRPRSTRSTCPRTTTPRRTTPASRRTTST